jgi:hypothetical protein
MRCPTSWRAGCVCRQELTTLLTSFSSLRPAAPALLAAKRRLQPRVRGQTGLAALVNARIGVNDIVQIYFISPTAPDKNGSSCSAFVLSWPGPGRGAVKAPAPRAACRGEDAMSKLLERRIERPTSGWWDRGFVPAC